MDRTEIYEKMSGILQEALGVNLDEITEDAHIDRDLGGESIDHLDIVFRSEKMFNIQIPRGEMFPDPQEYMGRETTLYYRALGENRLTEKGAERLKQRAPHIIHGDPRDQDVTTYIHDGNTVRSLVDYVESKLNHS